MTFPQRLWQEAAAFAARAHQRQLRHDGATPYVAHPFRVALTVRDVFDVDDEVCLAAALLHDVIEDCDVDYDDIADQFGPDVADIVAALSKDTRLPEPEREPAYDEALRAADWRAKIIKLADQYDNLCDRKGSLDQILGRAERALAIAREDDPGRPEVARGAAALEALIARASGA